MRLAAAEPRPRRRCVHAPAACTPRPRPAPAPSALLRAASSLALTVSLRGVCSVTVYLSVSGRRPTPGCSDPGFCFLTPYSGHPA